MDANGTAEVHGPGTNEGPEHDTSRDGILESRIRALVAVIGQKAIFDRSPGQILCEAWSGSHTAHHKGCHLVPWEELSPNDQFDWEFAAVGYMAELMR